MNKEIFKQLSKIAIIMGVSVGGLFITGGCSSSPVKPNGTLPKTPTGQLIVNPGVRTYPVKQAINPNAYTAVTSSPEGVWEPTIISKVYMDAYVDSEGRLVAPTYMYVIKKQGGWNLNAVRESNAYIPPDNAAKPYDLPGVSWGSSAVYANNETVSPKDLFDIDSVKLTGLVSRADEKAARGMAGAGEVVTFDERVGWVIIPQAQIDGVMNVSMPQQATQTVRRNPSLNNLNTNISNGDVNGGSFNSNKPSITTPSDTNNILGGTLGDDL